jgi:uncharacterized membrane protein
MCESTSVDWRRRWLSREDEAEEAIASAGRMQSRLNRVIGRSNIIFYLCIFYVSFFAETNTSIYDAVETANCFVLVLR